MSLLDNGPHEVTVFIEEDFVDSYGNPRKRPSLTEVVVKGCLISPVVAARDPFSDRRLEGGFRFMARQAPLGKWVRVKWGDRTFTVEGGPFEYAPTEAIGHVTATLLEER